MAESGKTNNNIKRPLTAFNIIKSQWLIFVTVIATGAALVGSIVVFFETPKQNFEQQLVEDVRRELQILKISIDEIKHQVVLFQEQLNSLKNISTEQKVASDLSVLRKGIAQIETKLEIFDKAIVDNPERAMSIPLLRRDIDALSTDLKGDLFVTRQEVNRVYDYSKWFLALMVSMAVGVFGLAVQMLKRKD